MTEKQPRNMTHGEWCEYLYDHQTYVITGLHALVEIIEGELQRGNPMVDSLMKTRKTLQQEMKNYSQSNLELIDHMPPRKGPLLAFDYTWTDDAGNVNRLVIKPGRREQVYNFVNRILRRLLLPGT